MPHVLLAQPIIGDLDVTVQGQEDVVQLQIAGCAVEQLSRRCDDG